MFELKQVKATRVEVWENEKWCKNTNQKLGDFFHSFFELP